MDLSGSCLCGDVAFELDGPLEPLGNCHCSMCRKTHGAAFVSFASVPKARFRWLRGTEGVKRYASSADAWRPFCGRCGSPVPASPDSMDVVFIPLGLIADDPKLGPLPHVFVGSRAPWYEITDGAPQFETFPPGMGDGVPNPRKTEPTSEAVRGGCQCGAVAYETPRPVSGVMTYCHCSRCRRARGAPHNSNLFVDLERFRWLRGADKVELYKLPEAKLYGQSFCRDCGSPMPRLDTNRSVAVVPAGSLDDDPGLRPAMHIFVGSKAPWFQISDDLPQYEVRPDGPWPPLRR
jgi:hypothetical protein